MQRDIGMQGMYPKRARKRGKQRGNGMHGMQVALQALNQVLQMSPAASSNQEVGGLLGMQCIFSILPIAQNWVYP